MFEHVSTNFPRFSFRTAYNHIYCKYKCRTQTKLCLVFSVQWLYTNTIYKRHEYILKQTSMPSIERCKFNNWKRRTALGEIRNEIEEKNAKNWKRKSLIWNGNGVFVICRLFILMLLFPMTIWDETAAQIFILNCMVFAMFGVQCSG